MKHKLIALLQLLLLCALCSLLYGCGGNTASAKKVEASAEMDVASSAAPPAADTEATAEAANSEDEAPAAGGMQASPQNSVSVFQDDFITINSNSFLELNNSLSMVTANETVSFLSLYYNLEIDNEISYLSISFLLKDNVDINKLAEMTSDGKVNYNIPSYGSGFVLQSAETNGYKDMPRNFKRHIEYWPSGQSRDILLYAQASADKFYSEYIIQVLNVWPHEIEIPQDVDNTMVDKLLAAKDCRVEKYSIIDNLVLNELIFTLDWPEQDENTILYTPPAPEPELEPATQSWVSNTEKHSFSFTLNKDTTIYSDSDRSDRDKIGVLQKGTVVSGNGIIHDHDDIYMFEIDSEDDYGYYDEVWIETAALEISGSEKLPESITEKLWVLNYYRDFLENPSKETFYSYEPYWEHNPEPIDTMEGTFYWWNSFCDRQELTGLVFRNTFIEQFGMESTGDGALYNVLSIKKDGNRYIVDAKARYESRKAAKFGFVQKIAERNRDYRFILEQQGDNLTVYLDNDSNILAELIAVNDDFMQDVSYEVRMLFDTNSDDFGP